MALSETMIHLNTLVECLARDLMKVPRGNKAAAQRVRVSTIQLEKVAKQFRKESVAAEKSKRNSAKKVKKRGKKR